MPRPRYVPPTPIPLEQRGGSVMWTSRGEASPEGAYHMALNLLPLNPDNPESPLLQRMGLQPTGTAGVVTGTVKTAGVLLSGTGQETEWILATTGLWVGGVNVVTAANFATAGCANLLHATEPIYWCVFANTIVFNLDLTNVNPAFTIEPVQWSGANGAASLTKLLNAGLCYGRPTVRSAKLFFIRFTERDTIVWSEENDATTGYDAGGFSNIWVLAQTGTAPLFALQGTNDGLYYFRARSTGVIRGEVNTDFVTASTHDAVSQTIGTTTPEGVTYANGAIWFTDQNGAPNVLPNGGYPRQVLPEDGTTAAGAMADPLGIVSLGIDRTRTSGARPVAVPPLPWAPYEMVWYNFASSTAPGGCVVLVCHATSAKPLGWIVPGGDTGAILCMTQHNGVTGPALVKTTFSMFTAGYVADKSEGGTVVSTELLVIGRPLGATDWTESRYGKVALRLGGDASWLLEANLSTSRDPAASIAHLVLEAPSPSDGRRVAIFSRSGRWVRPLFRARITGTSTNTRLAIDGWAVLAAPCAAGVEAA